MSCGTTASREAASVDDFVADLIERGMRDSSRRRQCIAPPLSVLTITYLLSFQMRKSQVADLAPCVRCFRRAELDAGIRSHRASDESDVCRHRHAEIAGRSAARLFHRRFECQYSTALVLLYLRNPAPADAQTPSY